MFTSKEIDIIRALLESESVNSSYNETSGTSEIVERYQSSLFGISEKLLLIERANTFNEIMT